MKTAYWDIADAGNLVQVYNDQIAGIPHFYPVSREQFETGFTYHKFAGWGYCEDIRSEKLIVGEQNGKIVGFADVAVARIERDKKKEQRGFIRFLTYQPGYRSVGQAILEEAEKYLADSGMSQVNAFRLDCCNDHCGYRFYHVGFSGISDQLGHICSLFLMNGYRISGGEIFMNQPDYSVAEPALPDSKVEIIAEQCLPELALLPGLSVKAFRCGKEIGSCESTPVAEFCQADEARNWLFIEGLFVKQDEQGKGLGRYLLQRNLWEMKRVGYRNTVISTDLENYRALLFYTNYGYHLVDTTYEFSRASIQSPNV